MKNLTLINGKFSPDEAKEILLNIFHSKIEFHSLKNLSHLERFGKPDQQSSQRIPELYASIEKILTLVAESKKGQSLISITSEIEISIVDIKDELSAPLVSSTAPKQK